MRVMIGGGFQMLIRTLIGYVIALGLTAGVSYVGCGVEIVMRFLLSRLEKPATFLYFIIKITARASLMIMVG